MKKLFLIPVWAFFCSTVTAQEAVIPVADNLVTENIPALPASLIAEVKNYTEARSASLAAWHPLKKEMVISTRFSNANQLHYLKMPGGDRKQITFFEEPVTSASFEPKSGGYLIFSRDKGGDEFSQLYRYDFANKKITLLTDGKRSQNGGIEWNNKKDAIVFGSTSRNGKDRDFYFINPRDPASARLVVENTGGGWSVADWSNNDTELLVGEYISVNESRIYTADVSTGKKKRILPEKDERTNYEPVAFSEDGRGIYIVTNKDSEFNRLAYYDLTNKKLNVITSGINWDIQAIEQSKDGKKFAFTTNENGLSRIYLLDLNSNKYAAGPDIPTGIVSGLRWSFDSKSIGFSFASYNASADVFEWDIENNKLVRWTESELGGMDLSTLSEPRLISWKSFDQRMISGYLYKPSSRFTGKRPVIISIHGGPEGQSRPNFLGRNNYFLNELGVALIYPNVRGSSGYGKSFLDLDNGMKREESVRDIGALLDWIAGQPDLDASRVMVMGGSYGGYMTLAVSYMFADKIRCAIDVVGISNFNTFMKNTEAYRRDLRRVEYGDERDPAMAAYFEKIAPLNNTDKIKKPLFIVQGGNDPRVPATESLQMKDKISRNAGTVWFLMAKDEGHGFAKKSNQDFQFYSTIAFVKKFLVGDADNVSLR